MVIILVVRTVSQKNPSETTAKLRLHLVVGRHIITMTMIPTMALEITNTFFISEVQTGPTEATTRKTEFFTEKMAKLIEIVLEQLSLFGND